MQNERIRMADLSSRRDRTAVRLSPRVLKHKTKLPDLVQANKQASKRDKRQVNSLVRLVQMA